MSTSIEESDNDQDQIQSLYHQNDMNAIPLDDRLDKQTINKTKAVLQNTGLSSPIIEKPLDAQVTRAQTDAAQWIASNLSKIDPEFIKEQDQIQSLYQQNDMNAIRLDDRLDKQTINKTKAVLQNTKLSSPTIEKPLDAQVTRAQTDAAQWIASNLSKIDPEFIKEVENAEEPEDANYIFQIRTLIAQILTQMQRIAEKDRLATHKLETEFKALTAKTSELEKSTGLHSFWWSMAILAVSFMQGAPNSLDASIAKIASEQVLPGLKTTWLSTMQADMHKASSLSNWIVQKYSAQSQKQQSNSGNKSELIQLLSQAFQGLEKTARAA